MYQAIEEALAAATDVLRKQGILPSDKIPILVQLPPPKVKGNYTTNLAFTLAPITKTSPLALAEKLVASLPALDWLDKVEIIPPGFINFYCHPTPILKTVATVIERGDCFGAGGLGKEEKGKKILVEYVSANPTGPLHIGHGRAAALGSTLVNVMNFAGYKADGEYYVNDGGRQMKILTATLCIRLMQLQGTQEKELPDGLYQGSYLVDFAREWYDSHSASLALPVEEVKHLLEAPMEKEERLDKLIRALEESLGEKYEKLQSFMLSKMIEVIKKDLSLFATHHHSWYYESQTAQKIDLILEDLFSKGLVYEKGGAMWFHSKKFGDDKDRVLKKSDHKTTYFLHDIAYHNSKYERHYHRLVDLLGSDHHGYMNRIRAAMQALSWDPHLFSIHLVQFVFLVNNTQQSRSMSTRGGDFVSLQDLIDIVGVDVARFFFLMYRADQPLKFDIELATSQTKDNPVYYIQYAHARIASLFAEEGGSIEKHMPGLEELQLLKDEKEIYLAILLDRFPTLVANIAQNYEVHQLTNYLRTLAREFHSYYNNTRILGTKQASARLCLCAAIQQTLANGLNLLGVSAPTKM